MVVLPASGWLTMAKVRRFRISSVMGFRNSRVKAALERLVKVATRAGIRRIGASGWRDKADLSDWDVHFTGTGGEFLN